MPEQSVQLFQAFPVKCGKTGIRDIPDGDPDRLAAGIGQNRPDAERFRRTNGRNRQKDTKQSVKEVSVLRVE